MAHLMGAMGLSELHDYGGYGRGLGVGVTLDNDAQITRRTLWLDDTGTNWMFDVKVSVEVSRRKVTPDGR
jgi:hypothetical protein